ncbi:hypothetical protein [Erysipelothrix aquatica]|uniref:hypothetical protein n=1 Tax=Erysipelothrix aquatica TaxID=2683714 RepID=UPI00135BB15D|nr:hypothetical protein [Erysipelothrix aquatica]
MKQVTYEEATLSFLEIRNGNDDIELVKTVLDYMHQHKPPTWEEVVKAWEEVDKDLNVYIHNNELCVTDIDEEETSVFWYDIITGGYEFECSSMEMINAINLTIRYLEAQKHHDL